MPQTYDAWGKPLTVTGSLATTLGTHNPLRYRGYVYDTETELYYLQSRYYNPDTGRFLNADAFASTGQGFTGNNMFAYCGNNPVARKDDGGAFWHIVVGAVVGAVIGGMVKAVSNLVEGANVGDGLGTAIIAGAASGALASTGIGTIGMIAGNATISMAENAANQIITNNGFNDFNVGDMILDGVIGGISGAVGGAGKGSKHFTNLGKQTITRTVKATTNKGIKAGIREAGKAFTYYAKNTAKYYKSFFKGIPIDIASTAVTSFAASGFMKGQYLQFARGILL